MSKRPSRRLKGINERPAIVSLPLAFEEVESLLPCGLRQEWIDAEAEGLDVELTCGAGLGSPWLVISINKNGMSRRFRADMRAFLSEFVSYVLASDSKKWKTHE